MMGEFFITLLHRSPLVKDGGPDYHEFHWDHWFREPWNALSSLFFLVPVFYWVWRLRGEYKENMIITAILPLLFLNGMGSTLYHAFRASSWLLLMDWLPALLMMLTLGSYFWTRVAGWWRIGEKYWFPKGVLVIPILIGIMTLLFTSIQSGVIPIPRNMAPNIFYTVSGVTLLLLPILIILRRSNYYKWQYIALTSLFLLGAVVFRSLDKPTPNPFPDAMPQGTHFLWHIVSAFAVFSLGWYLYYLKDVDVRSAKQRAQEEAALPTSEAEVIDQE